MREISISVSRKILADVSSGIYRTPANALKELVSNAFDASATKVFISTNIPYYTVFTCEDNGEGISKEEFIKILNIIGSSTKREKNVGYKNGRPIIGKIGIGLLAIAQICRKFTVISKKKDSKYYFQATIDLKQFDEPESKKKIENASQKISLGKCQLEENLIDEVDPKRHYTKVIMEEIKEGFKQTLLEEEAKRIFGIEEKADKSEAIIDFIRSIKNKRFEDFSQYDKLIWELCLNCPIEYLEEGPLPENKIITKERKRLKNYNFKVFIDGFELKKPVLFPTDRGLRKKDRDYKIYSYISFKKKIDNSELSFSGYIFNQRVRILPAELRGVLIRIKDVAIGGYDRTFLHYPKSEGPMMNQISGEIFVEQGLEDALNIDRNSFNETHIHFLELQKFLWNYLGGDNGIFKDIRKRSKDRRDLVRVEKSETELLNLIDIIKKRLGTTIKIERKNEIKKEEPYVYDKKQKTLTFYQSPFWARSQRKKLMQEKIILAVIAAKDSSTTLDSFEKNILKLFSIRK